MKPVVKWKPGNVDDPKLGNPHLVKTSMGSYLLLSETAP